MKKTGVYVFKRYITNKSSQIMSSKDFMAVMIGRVRLIIETFYANTCEYMIF